MPVTLSDPTFAGRPGMRQFPAATDSPLMSNKGTILIIDDEKDLIEMVRYNLDKDGYDVISATDGQSGLGIAQAHKLDLIILDLMMPGIDGLEVCRRLRADPRTGRIPLIMLTARATE